ncbi:cytidylyltransferase domain-containing protein [Pararhizobium sp.]|uniref:acylneuraminate cytidylyltransferase family protein n=1 Tax=Pararhizobium sp. TaxID=1977563 RepID=UPI003D0B5EA4
MKTIAVIPARGGSKGLPGKNIIEFHGKPLICWTVEAALDSRCFDAVLVSTDSQEIADIAVASGVSVPWLRPPHLSTDEATTMDAVVHALDQSPADTVVVLQPTSPLRTAEDIRICVEMHRETGKPVVSVTEAKPWIFVKAGDSVKPAFDFAARRQDADYVSPNGAIYVFSADYARSGRQWWLDAMPYLMPTARSIDIDTPTDLVIARALYVK